MDEQVADVSNLTLETRPTGSNLGLLDLDNFCVSNIISYLNSTAFLNFCQTCSRFNSVASDRHSWNTLVLFRRISYLIQNAWLQGWFERETTNFKKYPKCNLTGLVRQGLNLGQTLEALSLTTAKLIWKQHGAVVTKLYSHLVQFTTTEVHNHPQANWLISRKNFHFKFSADKLEVQLSLLDLSNNDYLDDTDSEDAIDTDDDENQNNGQQPAQLQHKPIKVKAYINGKCIIIYKSEDYDEPYTRVNTDTEDVPSSTDPQSLHIIIDMFTKSIPKLTTPMNPEMLVDMLLSLPYKSIKPINLKFVEMQENLEPRWEDFAEKLSVMRKQCVEVYHSRNNELLDMVTKEKEKASELVYHLGVLLEKRSLLFEYVDRCYHTSAKMGFDLLLLNEKLVMCLLRRIDFLSSTCRFDSTDASVCRVEMKLVGSRVLKITFSWYKYTQIGMEHQMLNTFQFSEGEKVLLEWKSEEIMQPTEVSERLSPITTLLQKCVDVDLSSHDKIPQLTNHHTAKFFLAMMKGLTKGISGVF